MKNKRHFRSYDPNQSTLMPPSLHDWLPKGHLAYFVRETVEALDLSAILDTYDNSRGGYPAYHPVMMTQLLAYGHCVGVRSSRKIERATHESVPFRVLAANQHPDHPKAGRCAATRSPSSGGDMPPRSVGFSNRSWTCAANRGWRSWATSRSTGRRCARTRRSTRP